VSVAVEQGSVTLDIRYPDGQLVENASKLKRQAPVPRSGEYQIDVSTRPRRRLYSEM